MKKCKQCGTEVVSQFANYFCSRKCYSSNHYMANRCERRKIEDLPGEIWKEVNEYLVTYSVSNLGRIKSINRFILDFNNGIYIEHERLLKGNINSGGYITITTKKEGVISRTRLHRMIASAFIPNPENKPCINHKDFDRTNNHIDNLEWVTYSENIQHGYDNNPKRKTVRGENSIWSKLKEETVIEILTMSKNGIDLTSISKKMNIPRSTIRAIVKRVSWKHIIIN